MSLAASARGCLDLSRPGNAIAAGVLTFTGAFVAGGALANPILVAAAVLATAFATGAGNAINDYFDRDIDRINRPDRPIPRGAISSRGALAFSAVLFAAAVVLVALLPLAAIAIAVLNLALLIAYTELFKGFLGLGNVVVAFLTGSAFLFGGAAVGYPFGAVVLFALAAIATLAREIVKDVEDVAGDRQEGLNTLPIAIGERNAVWIAVIAMTIGVLASAVPFLDGTFGLVYLAIVLPADAVMLYAAWQGFSDPGAGQRRLKAGMLLAVGAFIAGRLVELVG